MNEWCDLLKSQIVTAFDLCFRRQGQLRKYSRGSGKLVANSGTNGEKSEEGKWNESLSEMGKAVRAKSKNNS